MHLRQNSSPQASAAKAGFSTATAYRIEDDPRPRGSAGVQARFFNVLVGRVGSGAD